MLETISPRQFREWMAEYNIQPWGQEWEQAATVAAAAHNAGMIACNRFDIPADYLALRTAEHFDPRKKVATPRRALTVEQDMAEMQAAFG